ncbi:MAG: hypothetical protein ACRDKL_12180, partial [Solirubrobacteraceae bacterium]
TTSNYVDAWFVGWTPQMTVAIWVGYPNSGKPMLKSYDGGPVEGGTFPAIIWHNFMVQALQIMAEQGAAAQHQAAPSLGLGTLTTPAGQTSTTVTAAATTTSPHTGANTGGAGVSGAAGKGTNAAGSRPTQGTRGGTGATHGGTQAVRTVPAPAAAPPSSPPATTTPASPATTTPPTTQTGTSGGSGL